jgi:ribosomal protein S20
VRSAARTYVTKALGLIEAGALPEAEAAVREALSVLDRAEKKGVIHANNAARRKSRLMIRYNAALAAAAVAEAEAAALAEAEAAAPPEEPVKAPKRHPTRKAAEKAPARAAKAPAAKSKAVAKKPAAAKGRAAAKKAPAKKKDEKKK